MPSNDLQKTIQAAAAESAALERAAERAAEASRVRAGGPRPWVPAALALTLVALAGINWWTWHRVGPSSAALRDGHRALLELAAGAAQTEWRATGAPPSDLAAQLPMAEAVRIRPVEGGLYLEVEHHGAKQGLTVPRPAGAAP